MKDKIQFKSKFTGYMYTTDKTLKLKNISNPINPVKSKTCQSC